MNQYRALVRTVSLLTLAAAACAAPPAMRTATPAAVDTLVTRERVPAELHWFRSSAEYRAVTIGIYRAAAARAAELSRAHAPGTWAVILDVDETALDNSPYEYRQAVAGAAHTDTTWYAWIRERAAPPVPGAVQFTNEIRRLGGRVAMVSNRDDVVCDPTRDNLRAAGFAVDVVLCRVNRVSDKVPRFTAVANGAAGSSPVTVLLWLGDNIHDFPNLTQASRNDPAALGLFGMRYFMLPNPLYGSWEANPK